MPFQWEGELPAVALGRAEATIELTYQMQLAEHWSVQPNLQYIIHPGGHVPNLRDPSGAAATPNALVLGMRTILKF
jgi:porin